MTVDKLNLTDDGMVFSEEIRIKAYKKVKSREKPIPNGKRICIPKINSRKDGLKNLVFLFSERGDAYENSVRI